MTLYLNCTRTRRQSKALLLENLKPLYAKLLPDTRGLPQRLFRKHKKICKQSNYRCKHKFKMLVYKTSLMHLRISSSSKKRLKNVKRITIRDIEMKRICKDNTLLGKHLSFPFYYYDIAWYNTNRHCLFLSLQY